MLDYDAEAHRYDGTRGGEPRAEAAAQAVAGLLRGGPVLDVAGGTGIVGRQLRRRGVEVFVSDLSAGMLGQAAGRLPGRVLQADGCAIPCADGILGGVLMIWLLHLVPDARPFIAEAARVLRAGGVLLTTVDKAELHGYARGVPATDSAELITRIAGDHHLAEFGRATFVGHGQGRDGSPDPVFTVAGFERLG